MCTEASGCRVSFKGLTARIQILTALWVVQILGKSVNPHLSVNCKMETLILPVLSQDCQNDELS